jgi:ribosome-binding protein aMBF1 (putative translation factor)
LRDGIYELRVGLEGQNYRMLYFFWGEAAIVITQGLVKEKIVPVAEIDRAIERKKRFERNPQLHTHREYAMAKKRKMTTDAVEILDRRYFAGKSDMMTLLEEERANAQVAKKIYDLRIAAGLSQRQLAKLIGTTASVICRLEDSDYEGHSLAMLKRIAAALDKRVEIRFVAVKAGGKRRPA